MINIQLHGDRFSQTATNATSAVTSESGVSGKTHYITDISGSSDKSGALILVKQGSTTIWQDIIDADSYHHSFVSPLVGASGALVSVTVDGTSLAKANIAGFTL